MNSAIIPTPSGQRWFGGRNLAAVESDFIRRNGKASLKFMIEVPNFPHEECDMPSEEMWPLVSYFANSKRVSDTPPSYHHANVVGPQFIEVGDIQTDRISNPSALI
jgi:hypothetical protein